MTRRYNARRRFVWADVWPEFEDLVRAGATIGDLAEHFDKSSRAITMALHRKGTNMTRLREELGVQH